MVISEISESDLAKQLHVERGVLTQFRKTRLQKGEDWFNDDNQGRRVMITETGLSKVKTILKLERGDVNARDDVESHSPTNGAVKVQPSTAPKTLTVSKLFLNPFMLAALDDNGALYMVQVASNLIYAVNDKLCAIPDPIHRGFWVQHGPKPNQKGDHHYKFRFAQYTATLV